MEKLIQKYRDQISIIESELEEIETKYNTNNHPTHIQKSYDNLVLKRSVLLSVINDLKKSKQLNKDKFLSYMFDTFPTVFENSFSREMLISILYHAEKLESKEEQITFLISVIPDIKESELNLLFD